MSEIRNQSIIEAVQRAAQGYGLKSLAPLLDKKPSSLYAELSPWTEPGKAKLGFLDALEIMCITEYFTGLELAAAVAGFRLCPVDVVPDKPTIGEEIMDVAEAVGDLVRVCRYPCATPATVHLAVAVLHREVDEAEAAKFKESEVKQ